MLYGSPGNAARKFPARGMSSARAAEWMSVGRNLNPSFFTARGDPGRRYAEFMDTQSTMAADRWFFSILEDRRRQV